MEAVQRSRREVYASLLVENQVNPCAKKVVHESIYSLLGVGLLHWGLVKETNQFIKALHFVASSSNNVFSVARQSWCVVFLEDTVFANSPSAVTPAPLHCDTTVFTSSNSP